MLLGSKFGMTTKQSKGPYLSDGLIGWFDGIWNNGLNSHSNDTTIWKNLGSEGQAYDATYMDGTVNWSEDSHNFVYSGGKCFLMPNSDILTNHFDAVSGGYSVQVVCMPTYQTTYSGIVGNQHKNGTNPLLFGQWQGSTRLFFMGNCAVEGNYIPLNQMNTYTLVADTSAKTLTLYRDNEQLTQASATFNLPTAGNDVQMAIGRGNSEVNLTDRNFQGKIYCVRFYDRALTPDEIELNVSIDKQRFTI